jgi:hypothetical protein
MFELATCRTKKNDHELPGHGIVGRLLPQPLHRFSCLRFVSFATWARISVPIVVVRSVNLIGGLRLAAPIVQLLAHLCKHIFTDKLFWDSVGASIMVTSDTQFYALYGQCLAHM